MSVPARVVAGFGRVGLSRAPAAGAGVAGPHSAALVGSPPEHSSSSLFSYPVGRSLSTAALHSGADYSSSTSASGSLSYHSSNPFSDSNAPFAGLLGLPGDAGARLRFVSTAPGTGPVIPDSNPWNDVKPLRHLEPDEPAVAATAPTGVRRMSTAATQTEAPDGSMPLPRYARKTVRESPHKPGLTMEEKSVGQMMSNLRHMAGFGKVPKLEMLHLMLCSVQTEKELALSLDALTLCRARFVKFTERTCALLVAACIRAGAPHKAAEVLSDSVKLRLWPARNSYHELLIAASTERDAELFSRVLHLLRASGHGFTARTYHIVIRAFVDLGDVESALEVYAEARDNGVSLHRGTLNVLSNGIDKAEPFPSNERAWELMREVISRTAEVDHNTSKTLATAAEARLNAAVAEAAAAEPEAEEDAAQEAEEDEAAN